MASYDTKPPGGTQFFSGRGVQPGFPKCGACELIIASERGSCELNISKFRGLRAKIWLKFPIFSQKRSLWTDYCLKLDPCGLRKRCEKGVFIPYTPPYKAHPLTKGKTNNDLRYCLFLLFRWSSPLYVPITMHFVQPVLSCGLNITSNVQHAVYQSRLKTHASKF